MARINEAPLVTCAADGCARQVPSGVCTACRMRQAVRAARAAALEGRSIAPSTGSMRVDGALAEIGHLLVNLTPSDLLLLARWAVERSCSGDLGATAIEAIEEAELLEQMRLDDEWRSEWGDWTEADRMAGGVPR